MVMTTAVVESLWRMWVPLEPCHVGMGAGAELAEDEGIDTIWSSLMINLSLLSSCHLDDRVEGGKVAWV